MKRIFTILVVCLAVGIFGGVIFGRTLLPASPMRALERELPGRAFAPRTSLDEDYQTCTPIAPPANSTVTGWKCGESGDVPTRLARLAGAGAGESIDPERLQAAALIDMIWWDRKEGSLLVTIEHLERALRLSPDSVALLVNLSAAYVVRAERMQNPLDLVMGVEAAREALVLDPDNHSALFNAALAAEALALDETAIRMWSEYLAVDSTSGWAAEAQERRRVLLGLRELPAAPTASSTRAYVNSFAALDAQRASTVGWDSVLAEWGRAVQQGQPARADSLLQVARWLGTALERRKPTGNRTLADAVRAIDEARMNPAATLRLAHAHQAYSEAQEFFFRSETVDARTRYASVLELEPPSLVLMISARLNRTATLAATERIDQLDRLQPQLDSVGYSALSARAQWIRSQTLLHSIPATAYALSEQAAQTYKQLGEIENYYGRRNFSSWDPYGRGDTVRAYQMAHEALVGLRTSRRSLRLHSQLTDLTRWSVRGGLDQAALAFQEEDIAVAMRIGTPIAKTEAYLTRASVRVAAGQSLLAKQDLDSAGVWVSRLDSTLKAYFEPQLGLARTIVALGTNQTPSIAAVDSVIQSSTGQPAWRLLGWLVRTDIHLAARDTAGARADLDSLMAHIRRMAPATARDPNLFHLRSARNEQLRERTDRLAMLHVRNGQPLLALEAVERGRLSFAPEAGDRPTRTGWQPPRPGQLNVAYALIGDTVLTWVIGRDSVTLRERRVNRDSLLLTIRRTSAMLESAERANLAQPLLRDLYNELIAPVRDRLVSRDSALVIVADGEIAGVPFAALYDEGRGRHLVQDFSLRMAPSLADAPRPALPMDTAGLSALLIANPAFDQGEHPTLRSLRWAGEEVAALRALYPRRIEFNRNYATVSSLRAGVSAVDVIHYAGHAVFDDARPERSFLVLADRGDAGRFTADSVGTLDLGGVRLVVLSACRTVRARQGRSGGFAGLSGAMLGAGAGGVVGSLWDANDRSTKPLMEAFHREYLDLRDPAQALRQAQLQMLGSSDSTLSSPAAWAGFRYVGR